jgi:hypothetical protein
VQLVFASWDLATVLPDLPEKEVRAIIEKLGINAVRSEAPLSCEHQELYLRQGILPVIKSE